MTRPQAPSEDDLIQLCALADDEVDAVAEQALRRRIEVEPTLRAAYESILAGRDAVRALDWPEPSKAFLRRIEEISGTPPAPARLPISRRSEFSWRSLAAAACVAASLGSGFTIALMSRPQVAVTEALIADAHRRGLLAASPVDVASSDRHTVKPWLDARLGISPPAGNLASEGFPLVGGRVEVFGSAPTPTLVYRHNEHLITLVAVAFPEATSEPRAFAADGYNMVRWNGAGYAFWAVSDLEAGELAKFVTAYRATIVPR